MDGCGVGGQCGGEVEPVFKAVADGWGDADAVRTPQGMLQDGEQMSTTGHSMKHTMELSQELLPFTAGDALQGKGVG